MRNNGFSLIELLIVVALIGILAGIATIQFNQHLRKSGIESQMNMLYSELMNARSQSLFKKKGRAVVFSANQFSIYSSAATGVGSILTKQLNSSITFSSSDPVTFDSRGILNIDTNVYVCVSSENSAGYDSLVLSPTQIQLGKREGADCDETNVKKR